MGIVVCILLGIALMLLKPLSQLGFNRLSNKPILVKFLALAVFNIGFWNAFVYGMREIDHFWGLAGIGSGVLMILASLVIFFQKKLIDMPVPNGKQAFLIASQWVLSISLLCFFMLYLVTLVRLNLGMPILQ